jgi:hypothetical protein
MPDDVLVTAILAAGPFILVGTDGHGIFRAEEPGGPWTDVSADLPGDTAAVVREILRRGPDVFAVIGGAAEGGVYKSVDEGFAWSRITEGFSGDSMRTAVLVERHILLSVYGAGVFRTTDDGVTWLQRDAGLPSPVEVPVFGTVRTVIFAGTSGMSGLYRSSNLGGNWAAVPGDLPAEEAQDIVSYGDTIYAGVEGQGLYFSTDTGVSWSFCSAGLPPNYGGSVLATNGTDLYWGFRGGEGVFRTTNNGVTWNNVPVSVYTADDPGIPVSYALDQNFPNPFNPGTWIPFRLPTRSTVRLGIFNVLGQMVAPLADGVLDAGYHEFWWRGGAASGVYFCRLEAMPVGLPTVPYVEVRKMLHTK